MLVFVAFVLVVVPLTLADENETLSGENETQIENETEIDNETGIENETVTEENESDMENETEVEDNTKVIESEDQALKAFTNGIGAKVRLLQLYKSVERQIIKGEEVVRAIKEIKPEYNTSELELILENLKALADEINDSVSQIPDQLTEENISELSANFVALINESRTLIRQFGTILHEDFSESELSQIRAEVNKRVQERMKTKLKAIHEKVLEYAKKHNEEVIRAVFGKRILNESDLVDKEKIRERIRSVLRNRNQEINQLKERIKQMREVQKQQIERIKTRIQTLKREGKLGEGIEERIMSRLNERVRNNTQLEERLAKLKTKRTPIFDKIKALRERKTPGAPVNTGMRR